MAAQVIPANRPWGHTAVVRPHQPVPSQLGVEPVVSRTIRTAAAVLLLVLSLGGMVAMTSGMAAATTPPEGPAQGLDM